MTENDYESKQVWERGWDGHEKAQLKRMSKLSLREKIKWLEEAQEMLENLAKKKGTNITLE